ncbi:hypothetical protein [Streptomyces malaysiense]|uniref:Integral membrane protein n=1 Tax=Streptomyces malaysiense TaxID=1428626 RepID=A0A1J4PWB9_9ACTN|nr:hypothetical protein [Streptomyces malaysiense]OIK25227.1 hypothetical protein VT52_022820 [Streptomyces malaysiense]
MTGSSHGSTHGSTQGSPHGSVHGPTKAMGALTVGTLVAVTAYTVALGGDGRLWFGWVVLGLLTLAMAVTQS